MIKLTEYLARAALGTGFTFLMTTLGAGAVFAVVWNQEREKAGLVMPMTEDTSGAVRVGIEAIKKLIAQDQKKKQEAEE